MLVLAVAFVPGWAGQQESRKPKLPGLEKIVGGSTRQAFTGRVQSLDLQRNILNIDTVEGKSTEIFPVKKDVRVRTVDGEKLKLTSLTPGTNVIIYYDQRADRRTVREIIVLATGAAEEKKSPPPS